MASYSIFIPDVQGATDAHFDAIGLPSLAGTGAEWCDVWQFPIEDGVASGVIATWRKGKPQEDAHVGYQPEVQQWLPAKADTSRGLKAGRFWYGIEPERRPSPKDLHRSDVYSGSRVELRDGNHWLIPVASKLPHIFTLGENGEPQRRVEPKYEAYYELANRYMVEIFTELDMMDWLAGEGEVEINDEPVAVPLKDGWRFCCLALELNYRVTPEIIDLLELIDDRGIIATIGAAIDLRPIIETRDQKKSYSPVAIPLGSTTSDGGFTTTGRQRPLTNTG